MTEWRRTSRQRNCGVCGEPIYANQPALFVKLEKVTRELVRGSCCAGPAPPDLPEATTPHRTTKAMQPLRKTALGWTRPKLSESDWTARILGEKNS